MTVKAVELISCADIPHIARQCKRSPFSTAAEIDTLNEYDARHMLVLAECGGERYLIGAEAGLKKGFGRPIPLLQVVADSLSELGDITRASERTPQTMVKPQQRYAGAVMLDGMDMIARNKVGQYVLEVACKMDSIFTGTYADIVEREVNPTNEQLAEADAWFEVFVRALNTVAQKVRKWLLRRPYIVCCSLAYLSVMYRHDHRIANIWKCLYKQRAGLFYEGKGARRPCDLEFMRGITLLHLIAKTRAWIDREVIVDLDDVRDMQMLQDVELPKLANRILMRPMIDIDRRAVIRELYERFDKYGSVI